MVIRRFLSAEPVSPKGVFIRSKNTTPVSTVIMPANVRKPIPVASPTAIEKKILTISLELPGTERKRIRLKVPRTATLVPTFPFTSIMTSWTSAGRIASVTTKFLV